MTAERFISNNLFTIIVTFIFGIIFFGYMENTNKEIEYLKAECKGNISFTAVMYQHSLDSIHYHFDKIQKQINK